MQYAYERKIVLVTPLTLWGYLWLISWGWKQREVERKFDEIQALGRDVVSALDFLLNDLDSVRFTSEKASGAYEIEMVESVTENNQIETDEYGRVLYDCEVRRAGEAAKMDAEKFTDWYVRLAALSADGDLPEGFEIAGESRAAVVLRNSRLTRTVAFYPCDALHDAMAVDGVALFYIQKSRVDAVMELP